MQSGFPMNKCGTSFPSAPGGVFSPALHLLDFIDVYFDLRILDLFVWL